jgi:hypothetical protein
MSKVAGRVGHSRKLLSVVAKSFIDRFGSGLKLGTRAVSRCTLAHFPELWPTFPKLAQTRPFDDMVCRKS